MRAAATAAALLVALSLFTSPVQSLAGQFLTIFRVQDFQPITLSGPRGSELAGIPDLTQFGDMSPNGATHAAPRVVGDVASASAAVGFPVKVPGQLPAGIDKQPSQISVTSAETMTFTFRAAKTRAYLDSIGRKDFALPAKFDGASVQINVPAAAILTFSTGASTAPAEGTNPAAPRQIPSRLGGTAANSVLVAQAKAPSIDATGVTFEELRDFLLSLPGLSPQTAAQIRAIGDLNTTLPVPIPSTASARKIQVNGGSGLIIAEQSTRIAGGIVWQAGGVVYAAGGPLNEGDLMSIASSLR
jgi:hypothetical protein